MAGVISEGDVLWRNREDTVRVTVQVDVDPGPPEDDMAMPTLRIDDPPFVRATVVQVRGSTDYGFDHMRVWRHFAARWNTRPALEVFARYLRAFHGTRTTHSYNMGVTGEYWYFIFDTAAWREAVGVAEDYEGTAEQSFAEYRAYLTGNAWGLQLEHKVRRECTTTDLADPAVPLEWTQEEEWVTRDSVWGIYGDDRDWALELAREHFTITTSEGDQP